MVALSSSHYFQVYLPITYENTNDRFYDSNVRKKIKLDFDEITVLAYSKGKLRR